MSDAVKIERNEAILEVTLDRPKANAIDAATSRQLGDAFVEFRDDPALSVAIFTGAGERFFSAGWDLKAAAGGEAYESDYGPGGFGGFPEPFDLNKPVIAAVNGLAVGGGFELALGADLIVAADHAQFFTPEVRRGIIPDPASLRLPRRLPRAVALEMLLTGRPMSAQEALRWGLVNAVVPGSELLAKARALAQEIAQGAPLALAAVKEVMRETEGLGLPAAYAELRSGRLAAYERMLTSEDAQEGPRAFAEKRSPKWRSR
jgi:crotonobetainyl-CoA hydratase